MKKRLIFIYIFFFIVEYSLRTFVKSYKYHEVGFFLEFLPLVITSLLVSVFYKNEILKANIGLTYFQLTATSIGGLLTAKTVLYFQWYYWLIAPEYRNVPGDMNEGLVWDLLFLIIGSLVIGVSYLILIRTIKLQYKSI